MSYQVQGVMGRTAQFCPVASWILGMEEGGGVQRKGQGQRRLLASEERDFCLFCSLLFP